MPVDEQSRADPSRADPPHAMTPEQFNASVTAVTSAFGDPTRREIYLFVRESGAGPAGGVTASEVAERFELHPNVARHHLEKLTGGGYLDVVPARGADGDTSPETARGAGRPSKRYRVSDVDATLSLPPRHDDLLAQLLARALDLLGPEQASAMADEIGFDYGRALAEKMGTGADASGKTQRSLRSAMTSVAEALTAHGFAAHTEARGRSLAIVSECCPFGEAAQRYPHVVCAIDRGMIRGMLTALSRSVDVRFEEWRPEGDEHCVTRV